MLSKKINEIFLLFINLIILQYILYVIIEK